MNKEVFALLAFLLLLTACTGITYGKTKDEKKGWYIYYWTFVPSRALPLLKEMRKKHLEKIKQKLASEQSGHFYVCENDGTRQTFEHAIDHEFKCHECGSLMNQEDNTKKISNLMKEIEDIEKELKNMAEVITMHHKQEVELIEVEDVKEMKKELREANKQKKIKLIEKENLKKQNLKENTQKKIVVSKISDKIKSKFVNKPKNLKKKTTNKKK